MLAHGLHGISETCISGRCGEKRARAVMYGIGAACIMTLSRRNTRRKFSPWTEHSLPFAHNVLMWDYSEGGPAGEDGQCACLWSPMWRVHVRARMDEFGSCTRLITRTRVDVGVQRRRSRDVHKWWTTHVGCVERAQRAEWKLRHGRCRWEAVGRSGDASQLGSLSCTFFDEPVWRKPWFIQLRVT
jgi:hypothetical protein